MRKMLLLALALVMALSTCALAETAAPKYVFMFIGDGMGNPQVTATQYYLGAMENPDSDIPVPAQLSFTQFEALGLVTTYDASSFCPDSASTATSMASGEKTLSGVINYNIDKTEHAATSIHETIAFSDAVQVAIDFAKEHADETLIIVTADHETGGMTIGFATTAYDTHFNYLTSQKISFADFDAVIADLREKNAAFEDALEAVKTYYGLTTEADQPLSLTEADVQALKAAFELSMTAKDARKENAEDALLYGGYEPFSMAVSHIMNNKAGLSYTSYAHTGLQIPVYAQGVGAQTFSGLYDNTDIFNKTMDVMGLSK